MNLHSALLDPAQDTGLSMLLAARAHNPLELLGPRCRGSDGLLRMLRPAATRRWLETPAGFKPLAASTYDEGTDVSNGEHIVSKPHAAMGHAQLLVLMLPPLAGPVLERIES